MSEEIKDKDLEKASGGNGFGDLQRKRQEKAKDCPNYESLGSNVRSCIYCENRRGCPDKP